MMPEPQTEKQDTICDENVCVSYYRNRSNKLLYLWDQWKLFDLHGKPWRYWRGNIKTFGLWSGLRGSITLSSPFMNKILNWKHRNKSLGLNLGGVPVPMEKLKND
jgi:hypothetical protein